MAKKPVEAMVLVGFGKRNLTDLLEKLNTEEEEAMYVSLIDQPPRWRRESICSQEEIQAFVLFTKWSASRLCS